VNLRRCDTCGKFLPRYRCIMYVERSGASETVPREPIYLCKPCYDKSDKGLIDMRSWIKPRELRP
jgi:ribosomal protein L24E